MLYWTVGLLAVDMALMGGVLYILFHRRDASAPGMADSAGQSLTGVSYELIGRIQDELEAAKKITTELDRKRRTLDGYERTLDEKKKELDVMINDARGPYVGANGSLPRKRQADDVYQVAMKMINKGAPIDEVTDMLGLLNGEAELINSVSNFKS